ncbi:MAG: prepilin-type N-terminal cleavage/methylation domain-containing protein [Kiritimatiellae bacterium]|nr:prepilin-type N-terminal cleavage/methylation domain-containing protein [Kiritimatiellia bacterium]
MMDTQRQNEGWTLLECMIVVSIIGVMALIAVPTWTAARNRSQEEVCCRNQNLIYEQMNIYCLEHNVACDVDTFPHLCAVRDALVPTDNYSACYIKKRTVFSCPSNPDQLVQHDYRFVRDGNRITDIECNIDEDHNGDD